MVLLLAACGGADRPQGPDAVARSASARVASTSHEDDGDRNDGDDGEGEDAGDHDGETTVVSPRNMRGWAFYDDNTGGPGTGSMVVGPGRPPAGRGSARLTVVTPADRQLLSTARYAGTRLDAITALSYWTYRSSPDPQNVLAIALQLDVDYDLSDANTAWQGRLVFEPYQAAGNTVLTGIWQSWDALAGKWWASGAPGNTVCPQSKPCTWAQVLDAFPNAGLRAGVGYLHFKAGGGWTAFSGNVDAFTIGIRGHETVTWDFEPAPGHSGRVFHRR